MALSVRDQLALLPADERETIVRALPEDAMTGLSRGYWDYTARPEQLAPLGAWAQWWIIAGRGFGKTRTGAEWIQRRVMAGQARRIALVGATASDVRDVMVEGESGIIRVAARYGVTVKYEPSKRRVTWPNGAVATTFAAEEPNRLRGPEHDTAWCDEPAAWRNAIDARDNLAFGLRIGNPQSVWTTTPKGFPIIRETISSAKQQGRAIAETGLYIDKGGRHLEPTIRMTTGSTYENTHNLAPAFLAEILGKYEGTRLGRQELHAELLEDLGTTFHRSWFHLADDLSDIPDARPGGWQWVRYYDLAGTVESDANPDPDWTAGAKVGYHPEAKIWCVADVRRGRLSAAGVDKLLTSTAREDSRATAIGIEQEPGSAGKLLIAHYKTDVLAGYRVTGYRPSGPKEARASLHAGAAEQGRVWLLNRQWTTAYLDEHEEFPAEDQTGAHDDMVDATSGAFEMLRRWGRRRRTTTADQIAGARIPSGR